MSQNQWLMIGAAVIIVVCLLVWKPWVKKPEVKKSHIPAIVQMVQTA